MHIRSVLPEEILLEIFSETDKSDLQKLLEISLEWRDLLIRNVKVMRKLPLILMNDTWTEKLEFVENYGKFIREVNFVGANIESFDDVLKVLRLTPNVERISLENVKINEKENSENSENEENPENVDENFGENVDEKAPEKLTLKKLKEVIVLDKESVGSLKFITTYLNARLASLKCDLNDATQKTDLEQFLTENHQIKSLEISSKLCEIFNPSDDALEEINCQLEKLFVKSHVMSHNEQFTKFLRSQQNLREIGFDAGHIDFRYNQMMFASFPLVKKIQTNIDALASTDVLMKMKRKTPNKSIQSLTILGRNVHINIFDALLKLCPKIQQLDIQNLTQFSSDKIKNLPLTHLRVVRANRDMIPEITQPTKMYVAELIPCLPCQPKAVYERNLQTYCDLGRLGDKSKDAIEFGFRCN